MSSLIKIIIVVLLVMGGQAQQDLTTYNVEEYTSSEETAATIEEEKFLIVNESRTRKQNLAEAQDFLTTDITYSGDGVADNEHEYINQFPTRNNSSTYIYINANTNSSLGNLKAEPGMRTAILKDGEDVDIKSLPISNSTENANLTFDVKKNYFVYEPHKFIDRMDADPLAVFIDNPGDIRVLISKYGENIKLKKVHFYFLYEDVIQNGNKSLYGTQYGTESFFAAAYINENASSIIKTVTFQSTSESSIFRDTPENIIPLETTEYIIPLETTENIIPLETTENIIRQETTENVTPPQTSVSPTLLESSEMPLETYESPIPPEIHRTLSESLENSANFFDSPNTSTTFYKANQDFKITTPLSFIENVTVLKKKSHIPTTEGPYCSFLNDNFKCTEDIVCFGKGEIDCSEEIVAASNVQTTTKARKGKSHELSTEHTTVASTKQDIMSGFSVTNKKRDVTLALTLHMEGKMKPCKITGSLYCKPSPTIAICTGKTVCQDIKEDHKKTETIANWVIAVIAMVAIFSVLIISFITYYIFISCKKKKIQPQTGVIPLNYYSSSVP